MKFAILLGIVIAVVSPISLTEGVEPYKVGYFQQKIDHFVFNSAKGSGVANRRYIQRYLYTDKYLKKPNGPIFFYTGNEGSIDSFWNNTGFVFEIAPKFGALIVFAEHRYYGQSLPFGSASFAANNVQYLTVEQTLADFAVLVHALRTEIFRIPDSPVIAFGGSYGGLLTQYMRFKYPNLIQGGIVGSSPFYWIANLTRRHPDTFFSDVTKDFAAANAECPAIARQAFATVRQLFESGDAGMQRVTRAFNLCQPIRNATDLRQLYGWARNAFVVMAMCDYPYPTKFLAELPAWPVKASCSAMLQAKDSLSALRAAVEFVYGSSGCHNLYTEYVFCADPTGCGLGQDAMAWDFQACTEMHMPYGSDNATDMFPPLAFTASTLGDYCERKFGVRPDSDWLQVSMWGDRIAAASNLVFSNGDLDPWHNGGLLQNVSGSKDLIAVRIPTGAHHLDLRGSNPADPPEALAARRLHQTMIGRWLAEYRRKQRLHGAEDAILRFAPGQL